MKRTTVVALMAIMLASSVVAQSEIGQQEDFEDDTPGENPSAPWYTFEQISDVSPNGEVVAGGLDSTATAFEHATHGSGTFEENRFRLVENQAFSTMSFYVEATAGNGNGHLNLGNTGGPNPRFTFIDNMDGTVGMFPGNTNCGLDFSQATGNKTPDGTFVLLEMDWASTGDVTITVGDGTPYTWDCELGGDLAFFDFGYSGKTGPLSTKWDQIRFDGGPLIVEEEAAEPSEFSEGVTQILTRIGFATPESQLFFVIVLVGLLNIGGAYATKMVSPGPLKNYLLLGAGALAAVFTIFLAYLDLWMFIVAFMLAVFSTSGSKAARNTYRDLVDAAQEVRLPRRMQVKTQEPEPVEDLVEPDGDDA